MSAKSSDSAPADEAGESPRWLPLLGVAVFVVGIVWLSLGDLLGDEDVEAGVEVEPVILVE